MKYRLMIVVFCISVVIIGSIIYFFYQRNKEIVRLKDQARYLIEKVEIYRKKHNKLPLYEQDMELYLPNDYPISYAIRNDSNYVVGFQIAPFSSMVYDSETRKWMPQQ